MASLGSLVIELAANTARLQSDLGKAVGMAESAAKRFSGAFRGIATLAGVGSLGQLVTQAIELGDNLSKAAIKAGLGARPMSELAHAAKMADVDLSSLSTALKKMQVNISQAASGVKAPKVALDALGISIEKLQKLDADKQFELIADRIYQLKDPADKARAATELFGRAGADLLPLFEQGAAGIRAAREEAEKLGVSFSGEQLKALSDADDAIKRLKGSWEGFATALVAKVAPALSNVLDILHGDLSAPLRKQLHDARELTGRNFESRRGRPGGAGGSAQGYVATKEKTDAEKAAEARELKAIHDEAFSTYIEGVRQRIEVEETWATIAKEGMEGVALTYEDVTKILQEATEETAATGEEVFGKLSVYAEQAGRNMQDSLADFLFKPFEDGLDGMLKGFLDVIRRMIAEAAAADIFDLMSGGKGGNLSGALKGFGKLFGFASGGSFKVGGSGGVDSQLVAFKASPNETVSINKPGQGGGGGVTIVNQIDARGATQDLIKALPGILAAANRQAVEMSRAAVRDDINRGALR